MQHPPVTEIGPNRFADSMGKKLEVRGDPKIRFTKFPGHDDIMTLTLTINFKVEPDKVNTSPNAIPINSGMGDLFVADMDRDQTINNPDEIHFSYNNENAKLLI